MNTVRITGRRMVFWGAVMLLAWAVYELAIRFEEMVTWLSPVYSLVQEINDDQAEQLQEVCEEKIGLIQEKTKNVEGETGELIEWFLLAMYLVSQAAIQKRLAEAIIDRYFRKDVLQKGKTL